MFIFGSIYFPSKLYADKSTIGVLVSIWQDRMCVEKPAGLSYTHRTTY